MYIYSIYTIHRFDVVSCPLKLQHRLSNATSIGSADNLRPFLVKGSPQQQWLSESGGLWTPATLLQVSRGQAGSEHVVLESQVGVSGW
jgi:hypothetical protein